MGGLSLSRRFLNLIVDNHSEHGVRSLRCIDLKRLQLFYPTTPPAATATATATMEIICRLPNPSYSFRACRSEAKGLCWGVGCFPLADRKVLCTDQCGRTFFFDAVTRHVVTMPTLHRPKLSAVSLFVPSADCHCGGSLFLMERMPQREAEQRCSSSGLPMPMPSDQFEALVYGKASRSWRCQRLPPPPFVYDPSYRRNDTYSEITSCAVLGAGSHICISVEGHGAGTYCLDTASHTWSQAGKWTLPFHGKAEYVPELKLWFGISADRKHLAAADLSTALEQDSQPPLLVGAWKELHQPEAQLMGAWKKKEPHQPEKWMERRKPQLVNLGSGRFCIARFFRASAIDTSTYESVDQDFLVLTGVEVVPPRLHNGNAPSCGEDGKLELEMIPHKSICHTPVNQETTIEELF